MIELWCGVTTEFLGSTTGSLCDIEWRLSTSDGLIHRPKLLTRHGIDASPDASEKVVVLGAYEGDGGQRNGSVMSDAECKEIIILTMGVS